MSEAKPKIYRLQRLAEAIQGLFQRELGNQSFWVKAEIAEISKSASGHAYLSLVEERDGLRLASLQAVLWKADYQVLENQISADVPSLLQRGQELVLRVLVDFHPVFGLKLIIKDIDLSFSLGELEKRRQENLKNLEASGRIDTNRNIPEKRVWQRIALISSKEAAALKDFVQHLQINEFDYQFHVKLFPSKVQGKEAPLALIKALQSVNQSEYDCIVIVRGGGSSLDLDAFNDLALCFEILNCTIPVLSGIGHESDWTLVDRVSHTSQKTPTAVADYLIDKMVAYERDLNLIYQNVAHRTKDKLHLENKLLQEHENTLKQEPIHLLELKRGYVHQYANGLVRGVTDQLHQHEQSIQGYKAQLLDKPLQVIKKHFKPDLLRLQERLELFAKHQFNQTQSSLETLKNSLELLSPNQTLKRGFSITRFDGKSVRDIESLEIGYSIETEIETGKIISEIIKIEKNG